ncbi:DUF4083 domain-containing protein [Priestia megaterium]|uniref:DUF4083 domain-containing protein n=1 Tax=Priestia megaterium TaxID=1404 RepID=A0A3D8WTY5_PRIMG|nr:MULTISPECIES: DUF4083 family protein [Priestia]MCE4092800.1 DUF4083 domain-containing protein [Priestia megaterium]MCG0050262.1 DUF4083 domain-containing protein [Priestia aryabhattai]MDH3168868.1 DUF4083 family protein [Priestia megaterium]RDZ06460.1 DUF4083 domain-containing protein [Priestia megaterium]
MDNFNVISIVYLIIIIGLIALFVVSFTLFIRRLLINSSIKSSRSIEIEKKLDKVIELLEIDKKT